jgi:hypothetical protein
MAIATLDDYLREFSVEIGNRLLKSFPALHAPGDPVSPLLGKLLRKPFAAQAVAISGTVKRLKQANSAAIIAEMGTGKTLMAHGHRPRIRGGTSVCLSLRRAAPIAAKDGRERFCRRSPVPGRT